METIWLEVDSNEMMTTDFAIFVQFLNAYKMKYTSYYHYNEEDIIIVMEVSGNMTEDFNKKLSNIMAYQPIVQIEEPDVSYIDLIEEMSNT